MTNIKKINKRALLNNIEFCQSCGTNVMAMVKADAYGHGIDAIVEILKTKTKFFGVANTSEALRLREMLTREYVILVVGKSDRFYNLIKNQIDIMVDSIDDLVRIDKICYKLKTHARVHIAINTGMNRLGVKRINQFIKMQQFINDCKWIELVGVFTHCFDEDLSCSHFKTQMDRLKCFVNRVKNKNVLIHIGGSFCLNHCIPKFVNMVRVGYFLYGYGNINLKPVMSIESSVIKLTECKKDEFVGYGGYKLPSNKTLALVPVGYADGVPFNFAGGGAVYIKNKPCPVLGRICMDMMMVDVTELKIRVGQKVKVFTDAEYYAKITKTSTYEVLTNFCKSRTKIIVE